MHKFHYNRKKFRFRILCMLCLPASKSQRSPMWVGRYVWSMNAASASGTPQLSGITARHDGSDGRPDLWGYWRAAHSLKIQWSGTWASPVYTRCCGNNEINKKKKKTRCCILKKSANRLQGDGSSPHWVLENWDVTLQKVVGTCKTRRQLLSRIWVNTR